MGFANWQKSHVGRARLLRKQHPAIITSAATQKWMVYGVKNNIFFKWIISLFLCLVGRPVVRRLKTTRCRTGYKDSGEAAEAAKARSRRKAMLISHMNPLHSAPSHRASAYPYIIRGSSWPTTSWPGSVVHEAVRIPSASAATIQASTNDAESLICIHPQSHWPLMTKWKVNVKRTVASDKVDNKA